MASTTWSRIDVSMLYPPFLERLKALLDEAHSLGADFFVISGFRDYAAQSALYAQGRTVDGKHTPGPKVTNAKAGESVHNFGLGADVCRDGLLDRSGLQPDYRPESYEILRELAPKHGLVWGGSWLTPDYPHVQWPGFVTAKQLAPLKDRFEAMGLKSAFDYLDAA